MYDQGTLVSAIDLHSPFLKSRRRNGGFSCLQTLESH